MDRDNPRDDGNGSGFNLLKQSGFLLNLIVYSQIFFSDSQRGSSVKKYFCNFIDRNMVLDKGCFSMMS